jgi:ribosomal protein S18 acetylase RimI-like enzyme
VASTTITAGELDDALHQVLDDGIIEDSRKKKNWPEPVWYQVVARGGDGALQGGVAAKFQFDITFLDTIWVDERFRGKGIGRRLMEGFETRGRELGAKIAWLDTMSWQARPFYEKLGYRVFAELPYLAGARAQYFLRKDL